MPVEFEEQLMVQPRLARSGQEMIGGEFPLKEGPHRRLMFTGLAGIVGLLEGVQATDKVPGFLRLLTDKPAEILQSGDDHGCEILHTAQNHGTEIA